MADSDASVPQQASLTEGVYALIESDVPEPRRSVLAPFARLYLRRLPDADVPDLTPPELLAEIDDLLTFVDDRGDAPRAIRVFRPTEAGEGYETPGSVVQVVTDDGPFLVDSLTNAIVRSGYEVVRHLHPVVGTDRDADGRVTTCSKAHGAARRESVQHFELGAELGEAEAAEVIATIEQVLDDVDSTVRDFEPMRAVVGSMVAAARVTNGS